MMTSRWERGAAGVLEAGWLACVVAIPLVLSPQLELSCTADKVLLFRLMAELLGLVGVLLWLSRPQFRPAPLTAAIFLFAGVLCLSTLWGRNHSDGFWGSYMRLFGLFTRLHGWLLYLVVAAYFRTERQWKRLLGAIVVVSVLVSAYALIQWRGLDSRFVSTVFGIPGFHWKMNGSEQYRPFSTLGNASYLGAFLVFVIAFGLGALLVLPKRWRWAGCLLLGLLGGILILNQTRGAWLAVGVMGLAYALLVAPREKRRPILVTSGALAAGLLLFGGACARFPHAGWVRSNRFCTRLAHFFQCDPNSSGWYRLDMWRRVGREVAVSPSSLLLGFGPESYLLVASHSFEPVYADGSEPAQFMDSTHNIFADALVESGVLGLVALIAVLGLGLQTGLQALRRPLPPVQRAVLITATVALIGYIVQGMFLFDHIVTLIYLCLTLGLISAASSPDGIGVQAFRPGTRKAGDGVQAERSSGLERPNARTPERLNACPRGLPLPVSLMLAGAALAVVAFYLIPTNVRMIEAQYWRHQSDLLEAEGKPLDATEAMRTVCRLVPGERTYHVQLAASILSAESQQVRSTEELRPIFQEAEAELRRAIAIDPGDVRTYWPLGQLYQYWGMLDRSKFAAGEETYRRAAALSPRRQRTYWAWGDLELLEGKRAEAIARYHYALALDPNVAASQRALAQFYVRLGEPEQAEPLFNRAWQRMAVTTPQVLTVAQRANEHEALGLAFLARGERVKARAYLAGALSLNPQLARAREALARLSRQAAMPARASGLGRIP